MSKVATVDPVKPLTHEEKMDLRCMAESEIVMSKWEESGLDSILTITPDRMSFAKNHSAPIDLAIMVGEMLKDEMQGADSPGAATPKIKEKPDGSVDVTVLTAAREEAAHKLWCRTGFM